MADPVIGDHGVGSTLEFRDSRLLGAWAQGLEMRFGRLSQVSEGQININANMEMSCDTHIHT